MPKRDNPRWSRGLGVEPVPSTPPDFETVAARLKLLPEQYTDSPQLRAWVEANWRQRFVPEDLLKVWGLRDWGHPTIEIGLAPMESCSTDKVSESAPHGFDANHPRGPRQAND